MRILLFAALILSAPALAQPSAEPAPAAQAAAAKDEKLVCRREIATGSRTPGKRVCTTAAQREAQARDSQREASRAQAMSQLPQ